MKNGRLTVLGVATVSLLATTARAEDPKAVSAPTAPHPTPVVVSEQPGMPPVTQTAFVSLTPEGTPIAPSGITWKMTFYGFAEFDVFHDTTQSFIDASSNVSIQRPNTVPGDNGQTQFTPRNSRLGLKLEAVPYAGMLASAQAEMDFYGNQPPTASEGAIYTNSPVRMRHYFLTLKTPIVDVLAGQYHDLFAWGGYGFYPNSVAFLAMFGEVYHRNPQLRVSKLVHSSAIDVEVAVAAVRPVGRVGELPDGQAGVRLAFNGWRGVRAQGSGIPDSGPLQIGISGVGRQFRVNPFQIMVGDYRKTNGWGAAANIVVPVIPCTTADMRNAVTITGEATVGKGISDLYSGLTGGARYADLPNPMNLLPAPVYNANLDPAIVVFDADGNPQPVKWRAFLAGVQYHLPIGMGKKVWVSGNYAQMQSTNLADVTPQGNWSRIWTKGNYYDGNVFVAITPAVQVDFSYQVMSQTYADGIKAKNQRGELAMHYFF